MVIKSIADLKALAEYIEEQNCEQMQSFFLALKRQLVKDVAELPSITHLNQVDWPTASPKIFGHTLSEGSNRISAKIVFMPVALPLYVLGDIHGDSSALFAVLISSRFIERVIAGENVQLLFLGDYTDRGKKSLQTLILVGLLKYYFPANVTLLRGNHETMPPAMQYGLYDELEQKYSSEDLAFALLQNINGFWDELPYMAFTEEGCMFVHGGLPKLKYSKITEINDLIATKDCLVDLMWNDPKEVSALYSVDSFLPNERGTGHLFAPQLITRYLRPNLGISCVVRGHQVVPEGYIRSPYSNYLYTLFSTGHGSDDSYGEYKLNVMPKYLFYDAANVGKGGEWIPAALFRDVHQGPTRLSLKQLFSDGKAIGLGFLRQHQKRTIVDCSLIFQAMIDDVAVKGCVGPSLP